MPSPSSSKSYEYLNNAGRGPGRKFYVGVSEAEDTYWEMKGFITQGEEKN